MEYKIGEIYWISNPKAGKNKQSNGKLIQFIENNQALLYNDRWGFIITTLEDLEKHNG